MSWLLGQGHHTFPRCIPFSLDVVNITRRTLETAAASSSLHQDQNLHRKRKTEWKRRQGGQTFLDHLIINVRGGKGGDGCAAFHREKFKAYGPPSGGDGGRGGDVYIMPTAEFTTLSSIPKKVTGEPGGNGRGTWQNGRAGGPTVIKVPLGTVVRALGKDDPRCAKDEWEAEEESLEGLDPDQVRARMRGNRWLHYPSSEEDNVDRDAFREAEMALYREERQHRLARKRRAALQPIYLDLDKEVKTEVAVDAPLGIKQQEPMGHLVASGGLGGLGNPHFVAAMNRSPKYATRGREGERITLSLELKLLADVGLVGMPNAGKSTLLRALTGGRARSKIASYAFTTLNPVIGVVRVANDGTFEGGIQQDIVYEETLVEDELERERILSGYYPDALTRKTGVVGYGVKTYDDQASLSQRRPSHHLDALETFRFTIADNPGLISRASENVGLGHSFLRSIERSLALVYVVDFSGPTPWDELLVLREELEKYQPGMSSKARMVIANKADLLGIGGDEAIDEARRKLQRLEEFVATDMADYSSGVNRTLAVVPTSAKYSQNITKVVTLMRQYVEEAREGLLHAS